MECNSKHLTDQLLQAVSLLFNKTWMELFFNSSTKATTNERFGARVGKLLLTFMRSLKLRS